MTVEQHADVIKEKEAFYRNNYGIIPHMRIADPAIQQRNASTGVSIRIEYAQNGINWSLGQIRDVKAGLNKMNNYFRKDMWFITDNCVNFLKELKTYKRKTYMTSKLRERNNLQEDPQKKNDHACDSARYFFSFMPDLNPPKPDDSPTVDKAVIATMLSPGTTFNAPIHNLDQGLLRPSEPFHVIDETVGEY
jgi:hypothetical protein